MSDAQIHLAINHYPVVGLITGLLILIVGLVRRTNAVANTGLWIIGFAAITVLPAYFSGEGAEEMVEHYPHVNHGLIHEHEELAELALIPTIVLGLLAFVSIWARGKGAAVARILTLSTLVGGFVTLALLGNAAAHGGRVSHPELRGEMPPADMGDVERHSDEH